MQHRVARGLALCFVVVLFGCSKQPDLVGRWIEADKPNPSVTEFLPDGTFVIQPAAEKQTVLGPDQVTGTWSVLDDGRLKMTISGFLGKSQVVVSTIKFEGARLVLSSEGKTSMFNRVESH